MAERSSVYQVKSPAFGVAKGRLECRESVTQLSCHMAINTCTPIFSFRTDEGRLEIELGRIQRAI